VHRKVKETGVRIGDLASRSGVKTKTIRYYEDIGLVEPPARTPSGYRDYEPPALERLAFIRAAQAIGLTLGETRSIIALRDDGQTPCGHVLELLRQRADELDRRIAELRTLRRELRRLVDRADGLDPADCNPGRVCHLIGPA
jgi:MerR family transcriptional regulator, copper efflux regulator